jgi:FkbM family methyltransferase
MVPNPVLTPGGYMYWHPASYGDAIEYSLGEYERDTLVLLQSLISPGMIVVDVGASIGYYTLLFAKLVGEKGKVYAFEPQPWNCDVLRRSIKANGYDNNVIVVQKAVSNKAGWVPLYFIEPGNGEASFYQSRKIERKRNIMVEAITLGEFFENEGWPPVHIMKMDIEGAEKVALEGIRKLAAKNPCLKLIIEFYPQKLSDAGITPEELFDTMLKLGFRKFWIIRNNLQPLKYPQDIPRLVQMAGQGYVNLLCESAGL